MSDICIRAESLSKRFIVVKRKRTLLRTLKALVGRESLKEELWVLRDLSFEVKKGEKLAIVGKNGAGKTTLLRILTGVYSKTSGYVKIEEKPKALFKSWVGFNKNLSLIDNIYLFGAIHGIQRDTLKYKINKILETAELCHLRFSSLKELSDGQAQRLALSVFLQTASNFLIFDESLAFIDQSFTQKCESYFQQLYSSEKTVIMTSHNNSFLKKYCRTAIWLDKGIIRMAGESNTVINAYEKASLDTNSA